MKFQQNLMLLGVVGKKGQGKLDNGNEWVTDRVELHCVTEFSDSDSMSYGSTVTVYKVEDFNAHYDAAKSCVGKTVVMDFEMSAPKKQGAAPIISVLGFKAIEKPRAA